MKARIVPGSDPNSINLKTNSKRKGKGKSAGGMLPVAVLTTDDFDAFDVDDSSVHHRPSCEWRRENLFAPLGRCVRPSVGH